MTNTQLKWFLGLVFLAIASGGYLYNNAERQARDIKACQSVGAKWRYNSFNQVFCVPKQAQCKEYFWDER